MQSTENLSTKSRQSTTPQPEKENENQNLLTLLQAFNKDAPNNLKTIKQDLAELGKKYTIKDLRTQLEQTKKYLTETVKLKERLLSQKQDISDCQQASQLKLAASAEL